MTEPNLAEKVANESINEALKTVDSNQSFLLEAGAGSGKTYTLIQVLRHLIKTRGSELQKRQQKVACITFTKVATREIESRIDSNPIVIVETIHAFCWSLIRNFQSVMRSELINLKGWPSRIDDDHKVETKTVEYDLGYPKITDKKILLSHDDVIALTSRLMSNKKFRAVIKQQYPILLIDEYQDTNKIFTEALTTFLLNESDSPLIGLFGDAWQKIYGDGCGEISHTRLKLIKHRANFRSVKVIVDCLNKIRPELKQEVNGSKVGDVKVFHSNNWIGERQKGQHWDGDLPTEISEKVLNETILILKSQEWDFDPLKTKILMLTNNVLAKQQGYSNLLDAFEYKDNLIKKENDLIAFLVDIVEPICYAYEKKRYGEVSSILGRKNFIKKQSDKTIWNEDLKHLMKLREIGTIGDIIDLLSKTKHPRLSEKVQILDNNLRKSEDNQQILNESELKNIELLKKIRPIMYTEVIAVAKYIENKTPFSTKHGVKGAQFENVLVVFGRGWNNYNFGQFLDWSDQGVPADKIDFYERNRNLFYVVCSRPEKRLALLFTQKISEAGMKILSDWFGSNNLIPVI